MVFANKAYALDLDGSAGVSAKAIIATFGRAAVPNYLGITLNLTGKGASINDVAAIVVTNRFLPSDNSQFVQAVFSNAVDRTPSVLELLQFKGLLDRGEATQTSLLALAANTSLTEVVVTEISLGGVASEYLPTLA